MFPVDDREAMLHALEHIKKDADITAEQIEDTIITFGKKLWPYRRAFLEFLSQVEKRRTDEFIDSHIKQYPELYEWFRDWQHSGGRMYDLFRGSKEYMEKLSPEDRGALCSVLVETKRDVRDAAALMVAGPDKDAYKKRVLEFQILVEAIDERLDGLRKLADEEQEHPQLADEIRQEVRDFERGLAFLRRHTTFEAVCNAHERAHGRRAELSWQA